MKVVAFKNGVLAKCFDNIEQCSNELELSEDIIRSYYMSAKQTGTGWSFDSAIDYIDYTGYGFMG
jgi:hypothetical protein